MSKIVPGDENTSGGEKMSKGMCSEFLFRALQQSCDETEALFKENAALKGELEALKNETSTLSVEEKSSETQIDAVEPAKKPSTHDACVQTDPPPEENVEAKNAALVAENAVPSSEENVETQSSTVAPVPPPPEKSEKSGENREVKNAPVPTSYARAAKTPGSPVPPPMQTKTKNVVQPISKETAQKIADFVPLPKTMPIAIALETISGMPLPDGTYKYNRHKDKEGKVKEEMIGLLTMILKACGRDMEINLTNLPSFPNGPISANLKVVREKILMKKPIEMVGVFDEGTWHAFCHVANNRLPPVNRQVSDVVQKIAVALNVNDHDPRVFKVMKHIVSLYGT